MPGLSHAPLYNVVDRAVFEQILDAMPDAVFVVGIGGQIEFANHQAQVLLGYASAELIGMTIEDLVPSALRHEHVSKRQGWFAKPRIMPMGENPELLAQNRAGRVFPVDIKLSPVRLGGQMCAIATLRDISEACQREQALQASLRRMDAVAKITTDVICDFNAETQIFEWYGNVDAALHYEPGGFPRTMDGMEAHLHPDDHDAVMAEVARLLASGADAHLHFRIRTRDGDYRHWEVFGRPVVVRDGRPVRWVGACADVTDKIRAEQEQRHSEALSAAVLMSIESHVAVVDRDGIILSVNEAWRHFAQANGSPLLAEGSVGLNYLDVCQRAVDAGDQDAGVAAEGIRAVLNRAASGFRHEYACPSERQTYHFMMSTVPLLRDEGGAVITHTDITALRTAERAAQDHRDALAHVSRVATIGEIATSLAHELNQPLTAILNNAEAAVRLLGNVPVELALLREIFTDIIEDDRRAGAIIRRVRALLRKDSFGQAPVAMNAVVSDVRHLLDGDALNHGVTIETRLATDLPPVMGDGIQLQQVLINLLLNAFDALDTVDPARRRVRVTTRRVEADVRVEVRDWGDGLPEDIEGLFLPFYSTKPNGMGMGLAISRSIVGAHGGTLQAHKPSGVGAVFVVTLPGLVNVEASGQMR